MKKNGQRSANISGYSALFCNFFSKNDCEIELVVLHTINPMKSTKWVTTFSWIFHFSLKDFTKKFFSQMLDAFGVCGTMCKVKKDEILFWGDSQLPSRNPKTKVRLLYIHIRIPTCNTGTVIYYPIQIQCNITMEITRNVLSFWSLSHSCTLLHVNLLNI